MKATKYSFCGHYLRLSSLHNVCLNRLHLCSPVSLVESRRYYPTPTPPPPPPPPGGGGGRFKGFLPNPRPPGGPFRGGAQGGNPSDRAPYQGPQPVRSHKGAPSSLLYQDKNLTVKAVKTPMTEKFTEIENSGKAVEVLTRGFIKLKSTAKTSSTASSPSSSSQNRAAEDKEKGSKNTSYNHGRSSRPCSSSSKQKPPSNNNTDVQNTTKDAVNPSPSSTAGTTSTSTSLPTSGNSDSINTGGTTVPPVLFGDYNPYRDFSAAEATKLLRSFNDENLQDNLEAMINRSIAEVAKNGTFKREDKILAEQIMTHLNEGTERERLLKKLGFLERERLLVHDGSASEKLDPSFYSLIPKDFSKGQYADLPNRELPQYKFGMIKEPDKASINTVLLAPHQKHIGLFGKLPDEDKQVLMGYLTSHNTKRTFEISETQPLGGQAKAQYLYVLDNAIITNNNDIEPLPNPDNQDILNKYAVKHSDDILFALKDRTLARPHSAAFFDTREGINMPELDEGIFNHINEEQAKAFNLVQKYLKFKCEVQRAEFTRGLPSRHERPLAMRLFWDMLQYGKTSDFSK